MRHIISRLVDMSDAGQFSTPMDSDVSQALRGLLAIVEREGWEAAIDDVVIDGLEGSDFSMALFEVASCLEERGDVSSILLAHIIRGLANDQDASETTSLPTSIVWLQNCENGSGGDGVHRIDDMLIIERIGICECPRCRTNMRYERMWQLEMGIVCAGCGSLVKMSGVAVRLVAEDDDENGD
jgi:hypothetical protein